ncbi:MAG: DoxX family protein [Opitutaceae bacterium]|nr:DoxX family protein [Opitutaceae bacterium]
MKNLLNKLLSTNPRNWSPVALRLVLGLVMAAHGAQKLFGWFGGYGLQGTAGFFADKLGLTPGIFWATLAGSGEFFGGLLLILGLATRFAALNTAVVMLVAIITVHNSAFFMPAGMEFALSLLAMSVALVVSGGGALSADSKLTK